MNQEKEIKIGKEMAKFRRMESDIRVFRACEWVFS